MNDIELSVKPSKECEGCVFKGDPRKTKFFCNLREAKVDRHFSCVGADVHSVPYIFVLRHKISHEELTPTQVKELL